MVVNSVVKKLELRDCKSTDNADNQFAAIVMQKICTALIEEVMTTPKPGLVDASDNGAHNDMDWSLFIESALAISPYFGEMCKTAMNWDKDISTLFPEIRIIGMRAEQNMFHVTKGVNTHKGAIFIMGILAAAIGVCYKDNSMNLESVFEIVQELCDPWMEKDFFSINGKNTHTAGEMLYISWGIKGIRGEAQGGFPTLKNVACPLMNQYQNKGYSKNERNIHVLLSIMEHLVDTNVLSRSGYDFEVLRTMQKKAEHVLSIGGASTEEGLNALHEWNDECIMENISPGGAADMLAAAIFLNDIIDYVISEKSISPVT